MRLPVLGSSGSPSCNVLAWLSQVIAGNSTVNYWGRRCSEPYQGASAIARSGEPLAP